MSSRVLPLALAFVAACTDAAGPADAGLDAAGPTEAGPDAAAPTDANPDAAGPSDASPDASSDASSDASAEDAGVAVDAEGIDAGGGPRAALPPWLSYCEAPDCDPPPAVIAVCPAAAPDCMPTRSATILPRVDGHPIDAVFFPVLLPEGAVLRAVEGNVGVLAHLVTASSSRIELRSDLEVAISYYAVPPRWGDVVPLDFVTETRTSTVLESVFFRHPSFDPGDAPARLHTTGQRAILDERRITGVSSEPIRAFFLPSELAGVAGEGNFSYGDGTVTSNYGNPDYIAALGGVMNVAFPRFAHECAHELFAEVSSAFGGNPSCLNEGLADAVAHVAGHLPLADFGPIGLRGASFDDGCAGLDEIHDLGNCPLWQVYRSGRLDPGFLAGMFHPRQRLEFDSCALGDERTGNALLVLFTDAAGGADLSAVLDLAKIPHAPSYAAARAALGLP